MSQMFGAVVAVAAEGEGGIGVALVWLAIGLGLLAVFGPLAFFIGRDASRRGLNGWLWGILFLLQPVIIGIVYLVIRRRTPVLRP